MRKIICLIGLILLCLPLHTQAKAQQSDELTIHFIDVGQGDSMLIRTPNGKHILIDGGPPEAGKTVVKFLKQHHVKKLDLLIATHPDIDHIGGLPVVMKAVNVERILDSGKIHSTRTYIRYVKQIHRQDIPVDIAQRDAQVMVDPNVNIRILNTFTRHKNNNQSSIVLKLSYKGMNFLLMGDLERDLEKKLMKEYDLQATILKVAHHGSKTSSTLSFLKQVNPKIAIISYGKKNDYGHPVKRVIRNLNKVDASIFPTAIYGTVTLVTNGDGYFLLTEKTPMDSLIEKVGA